MGTTSQRVYEISDFKGLNLHDEARKIEPGQFTILTNASTDNNSIKADAVDSLIQMPVPNILLNTIGDTENELADYAITSTASRDFRAYYITGASCNSGDSVFQGFPFRGDVSANATGTFDLFESYLLSGGSTSNPGVKISDVNYRQAVVFNATASANYKSTFFSFQEKLISANLTNVSSFWAAAGKNYSNQSYATANTTAVSATASSGGWGSSALHWATIIGKYNNSNGGHILNILPFVIPSEAKKIVCSPEAGLGSHFYLIAGSETFGFNRIRFSLEPNFKSSFVVYSTGNSFYINDFYTATGTASGNITNFCYSDFNLIQKDGVFSLSYPDSRNGFTIDYSQVYPNSTQSYNENYNYFLRKKSFCFFNGNLVLPRNGMPVSHEFKNVYPSGVNFTSNGSYPINTTLLESAPFIYPKIVISYNNFLIFANVKDKNDPRTQYKHRMYFSTAGMIDAFSPNQYENLSDGEEILWIEEWYGSLIIFFSDRIKRYTGTPGNATLETIYYRGVSCGEMVCKTGRGIFFVSTDGLYLYNGTFQRIMDWSTKFDQADSRSLTEDGWLEFNDKSQELYFYPGYDSVVNVWNAKHNFFRQKDYTSAVCTGGMRFFKYYHNMDLKTAISYPSITHVSQCEAGTTYQAVTAQSGWIDVDEGQNNSSYEQKLFDRAIVEFTGTTNTTSTAQVLSINTYGSSQNPVTATIILDGTTILWTANWISQTHTEIYENLYNLIINSGASVSVSYINNASHADGIYITGNYPTKNFSYSISNSDGVTINLVTPASGEYFILTINFDDGSNLVSQIPLYSTSNIVSFPIKLNKQAKLIQYKITSPAQVNQLIIHKIKFYYDDTMFK